MLVSGTSDNETFRTILWNIRLPRTVLIALVGAALAGSGAAYQGLFRNPLADPYLIGVASGAGLGAILAMSVELALYDAGSVGCPAGSFHRQPADGLSRVHLRAYRQDGTHHKPDPGGRGGFLVCHHP